METKTKTFDCVEMKRKGAAHIRRETDGMTKAERLAYWKRGTEEPLAEQEALRGDEKLSCAPSDSGQQQA